METKLVTNQYDSSCTLSLLKKELKESKYAVFIAAFVKESGLKLLENEIHQLISKSGELTIVTGTYFCISDLDYLHDVKKTGVNCLVYSGDEIAFHPKIYMFNKSNKISFIIGSSNFSEGGLYKNVEANIFIEGEPSENVIENLIKLTKEIQNKSQPITELILEKYQNAKKKRSQLERDFLNSFEQAEFLKVRESLKLKSDPIQTDKPTPRKKFYPLILKTILEAGGEANLETIYFELKANFQFNGFDLSLDKGEPKWKHNCRFALEDLKREGNIEKGLNRGSWRLTALGKASIAN